MSDTPHGPHDEDGFPLFPPCPGYHGLTKPELRQIIARLEQLLEDPHVWKEGAARAEFDVITGKHFICS
ncbi:hypothetical protein ACFPL7_00985 [Dongia soli]|uniref:Uncharacterized protein n=1 Tax=Dongia soli TaxID=600628 RepID=A0ABU5EEG7_9PROT|nr:hypothetical protein [Dongia soli]MDY0884317.1 hypothetical protein [Dongia soli]